MGLPCAHIIKEYLATSKILNLHDIHKHWWIERDILPQQDLVEDNQFEQLLEEFNNAREELLRMIQEPPSHLLDPTITRTRGRPTGARNEPKSSTRRIPSAFELQELRTTGRKCRTVTMLAIIVEAAPIVISQVENLFD
ncbi:27388_t:CDS:2 [Gigaspora margarita]|uniref:27388_t:CDS:1 n=1 Tax=Gigaspora margarita TaxID=4874 RepID=A0ABN7VW90_GIGMA|nr:27388_t:CDS:2 [Gigaspora margarita]